jgi:predicted nucleic acid-binding protein
MTTVYVTDANIFIDLHDADLLQLLPQLEMPIVITVLILGELNAFQQHDLQGLIIQRAIAVREISVEEISEMGLPKGLSLPDRSVICLAHRDKGTLLSGDKLVRKTANALGIPTHGLLWLFDLFVDRNLISPSLAATKLAFLVDEKGRRQLAQEVEIRLKKWGNSTLH